MAKIIEKKNIFGTFHKIIITKEEAERRGIPEKSYTKLLGENLPIKIVSEEEYNLREEPELPEPKENVIIRVEILSDFKYNLKKQRELFRFPLEEVLKKYCDQFNITFLASEDKNKLKMFDILCFGVNFKPLNSKIDLPERKGVSDKFQAFLEEALGIIEKNMKKSKTKFKINSAGVLNGTYEDYVSSLSPNIFSSKENKK